MANCLTHGLLALLLCALAAKCETGLENSFLGLQQLADQFQTGANDDSKQTGQEKMHSESRNTNDSVLLSPKDSKVSTQSENADDSNIIHRNGIDTDQFQQNAVDKEISPVSGLTQAPATNTIYNMKSADQKQPENDAEKAAALRLLDLIKKVSLESPEQREELRQNISDTLGLSPLEPAKAMLPLGFGNPNPLNPSSLPAQLRGGQDQADGVKTGAVDSPVVQPQNGSQSVLPQASQFQVSKSDSAESDNNPEFQQNGEAFPSVNSGSEKTQTSNLISPDMENSEVSVMKNGPVVPQDNQLKSDLQSGFLMETHAEKGQGTEEEDDAAEDINIGNPPADVEVSDKNDDYIDDTDLKDTDYGDDGAGEEDSDDEYTYDDQEFDDQDENNTANTAQPLQTHSMENDEEMFGSEENESWGEDDGFGQGDAKTTGLPHQISESVEDDYNFRDKVPSWLKTDFDDVDNEDEEEDDDWYYKQNFDEDNSTPSSTTTRPYPGEPLALTENKTNVVSTQIKAPESKADAAAIDEPTVPKKALPGPKGTIILYTILIVCFIAGIVIFSIWKNPFKNLRPSHATPVVRTGEEGKRLLDHPFV